MSNFYTIQHLGNDKALVTDTRTGGLLHLSCNPDALSEESNMVDFINELQESLWEKKTLVLELVGESHIYFDYWVLLEGFIRLQDVDLADVDLKNVELKGVVVKGFKSAKIQFSNLENVKFEHPGEDLVVEFCNKDVAEIVNKRVYDENTLFRCNTVRSMGNI